MSRFERFEEIDAWKEGSRLAVEVYRLTGRDPFARDFGLRDQLRRSAISIPSNIAEGQAHLRDDLTASELHRGA